MPWADVNQQIPGRNIFKKKLPGGDKTKLTLSLAHCSWIARVGTSRAAAQGHVQNEGSLLAKI